MIYEGNRHDSTTVEEVVGTLAKTTAQDAKRIVVTDAGFYSKSNVNWLKANGFDYITVLPSGDSKFESTSSEIINHTDKKGQQIRLQMGKVDMDGESVKALMVDSDAKGPRNQNRRGDFPCVEDRLGYPSCLS
nr:transposase [Segatella copri]